MGEATRRKKANQELLARHPWCIYCGGAADSVDHVPAKMMFRGKQRPKGMEVPACTACNRGASKFEVIAHAMGRVSFDDPPAPDTEEFGRLLRDAEANNPGLLIELMPKRQRIRQVNGIRLPPGSGAFTASGPIMTDAMNRYAAKLGLALHWLETENILPLEGAVMTQWFTNYNRMMNEFPDRLLDFLGNQRTLAQGRFNVGDRFSYSCRAEGPRGLYFAGFQFSFATLAYVDEDFSKAIRIPGQHVSRLGFIKQQAPLEILPGED